MEEAQNCINPLKIVSNQLEYNLFDRYIEKSVMPYMFKNKSSIIAYSPLDKGMMHNDIKKNQLMKILCQKYNKTISQISLNWLLSHDNMIVIPKSINKNHLEKNSTSSDFKMDLDDIQKISKIFSSNPKFISLNKIKVDFKRGEYRKTYKNIEEAIENKFNMKPNPSDLAKSILAGEPIKPVRVTPCNLKKNYEFSLVEGHLRFWAWNIAYKGLKDIPCLIRKNSKQNYNDH